MNQEVLTVLVKSSVRKGPPPGNTLSDTHNSYTWNAESEIKTAAGVTYTYDGDGDRVQKSNGKIYWYGAGSEILDESDSSGNITDEYVFFAGQRAAHRVVSTNAIYYYAQDMLGSSRQIYTSAGIVCYDADFYPFGGERAYTNTCAQNYKFEGKERDAETNNDDFGARYYASAFGRWTSPDWSAIPAPVPYANLTNPQTLNLYSMAHDNPETFADLDGHYLQAIADAMEQEFIEHRESGQGSASKQTPPPPPNQGTAQDQTVQPNQAQEPKNSQQQTQQPSTSGSGRTPATGDPNTTVKFPGNKPGTSTERTYGPDGRAVKDIDSGHNHGAGDPHAHDWDWNKNPPRQPGRQLTPEEQANIKKAAVGVGVLGTAGLIIHTIIATAPEWGPWVGAALTF